MSAHSKTHEQFCAEVKALHGTKVIPVGRYAGALKALKLKCPSGHVWYSRPSDTLAGRACKQCSDLSKRKTQDQFRKELRAWNPRFELVGQYVGDGKLVKIRCKPCDHTWSLIANTALKQKWCRKCASIGRRNQPHKLTTSIVAARIAAKNPHFILRSEYRTIDALVSVDCVHCQKRHEKSAFNLMNISMKCSCKLGVNSGRGYSNTSIQWLNELARKNRVVIEHAENGKEFRIPGHRLYVDGYHRRSKTVFEFLGDYWHKRRTPDAEKKTMERLRRIQKLGYRVVYVWESEYLKGKAARYL